MLVAIDSIARKLQQPKSKIELTKTFNQVLDYQERDLTSNKQYNPNGDKEIDNNGRASKTLFHTKIYLD